MRLTYPRTLVDDMWANWPLFKPRHEERSHDGVPMHQQGGGYRRTYYGVRYRRKGLIDDVGKAPWPDLLFRDLPYLWHHCLCCPLPLLFVAPEGQGSGTHTAVRPPSSHLD